MPSGRINDRLQLFLHRWHRGSTDLADFTVRQEVPILAGDRSGRIYLNDCWQHALPLFQSLHQTGAGVEIAQFNAQLQDGLP